MCSDYTTADDEMPREGLGKALKPIGLVVKRGTLELFCTISLYIAFSLLLFFIWVNPSLTDETGDHIAADANTYMYFADSLREGRNEPWVLYSMATFPNNLWGPVFLGLLIRSTVAIVVVNYTILFFAIWLLHRALDLKLGLLFFLILMNVTTFISLLSLNKEIFDLLVIGLFIYYLGHGSRGRRRVALVAALVISVICRFETTVCIVAYLVIESRCNIFRRQRKTTLAIVLLALSISLPASITGLMSMRLDEALLTGSSGSIMLLLDNLQLHYLFFVAVIPKILDNLFAQLISFNSWPSYNLEDAANTFFLFGNNMANLVLIALLIFKKRFSLGRNLVYFACLSAIFMSISPVIQPRYFYGVYIVLCVDAALIEQPQHAAELAMAQVSSSESDPSIPATT